MKPHPANKRPHPFGWSIAYYMAEWDFPIHNPLPIIRLFLYHLKLPTLLAEREIIANASCYLICLIKIIPVSCFRFLHIT